MFGILCIDCRGDKSFCSMECRENFMVDEMEEGEPIIYHPASPRSPPSDGGPIFQLIRWVSISNNLIWSYLKCCLRLISCSHGCDHVCRVVAWRFCLLRHWWIYLTYWFLCFVYLDPRIFGGVQKMTTSGHNIILIGDGCVRAPARLNLSLFAWTIFSGAVICGRLLLISCMWTYVLIFSEMKW